METELLEVVIWRRTERLYMANWRITDGGSGIVWLDDAFKFKSLVSSRNFVEDEGLLLEEEKVPHDQNAQGQGTIQSTQGEIAHQRIYHLQLGRVNAVLFPAHKAPTLLT